MKFGILYYLLFSALLITAQNDTTVSLKGKWNKFKVKAEEKYDELKTSLEETSMANKDSQVKEENSTSNNNKKEKEESSTPSKKEKNSKNVTSIPFDQHIVAKNFKDGPHSLFELVNNNWEKADFEIKSTKEFSENGDVNKVNLGYIYEREREFNGFDFIELNSHFYCKEKNLYGIYLGGSFLTYKYSKNGDQYSIEKLTAFEKPDIKISTLKKMLVQHKQSIKDFRDNLPSKKYDNLILGRKYNTILVENNEKKGLMNSDTEFVVPLEYDQIIEFSEGFSRLKKDSKWMIMDSTFKIKENRYDQIGDFIQGSAFIQQGKKIGTLDKKLNEKWLFTTDDYSYIRSIGNYYKVKKNKRFGLISKDNKTILECKYLSLNTSYTNQNNIVIAKGENGLYGYYKVEHGWITERIYYKAGVIEIEKYVNGEKKLVDAMYVEIKNLGQSVNLYDLTTNGYVSIDGRIEWDDREITLPIKTPSKDTYPLRDKYYVRSPRILENHPIIVKDEKAQKEGLIDVDGNIIVDIKYQDITEQYPDYFLLEKFISYGSLGGDQTIVIYNVFKGLSGPRKIATENTSLGGAIAYTDSFNGTNSISSHSSSSNNSSGSSSSTSSSSTTNTNSGPQYKGTITVKNDTGKKLFVWLGSGSGYVNNGNTKLANCGKGVKVYAGSTSGSSSKKFLFEVTPEMCGKTIKLSKYL